MIVWAGIPHSDFSINLYMFPVCSNISILNLISVFSFFHTNQQHSTRATSTLVFCVGEPLEHFLITCIVLTFIPFPASSLGLYTKF